MRGFLIAAAATFVALGGSERLQAQSATAQPASPAAGARQGARHARRPGPARGGPVHLG